MVTSFAEIEISVFTQGLNKGCHGGMKGI